MGSDIAPFLSQLPVIEIADESVSTADQVRRALETYGCFVAKYDKISPELHDKMFKLSGELFKLPSEIKVKNTSKLLGFGYGASFPIMPLVEYFGIERAATLQATEDFTNLMWPSGNLDFCDTTYEYSKLLSELDHGIMRMVTGSYGVKKNGDDDLMKSSFYLMRFLKYRPPEEDEMNNLGLRPHVDKGFLGILDTNKVSGLEIQTKSGEWVTYHPSSTPSTFLVIAAEAFQAWSNGRIYAPVHKVVMRGGEEIRYTIGLFSFMRGKIKVPEELVDDDNRLKFREFDHLDFLEFVNQGGRDRVEGAIVQFCGI